MTAVAANWLRQTRRTYFGNAAAQRDFRVQLRGNRSVMLFGLYLAILIVVGFFKYGEIQTNASISVVQAQRELREFYTLIVMLLGGMVTLVTPGLAATAIVLERQRRSLDLVFSAPVQPRYYLVGKMIAVYRYIWMLLILSLPVTAACVVLGGASWSDVLTVYGLLSIHGLLFAAVGLLMSTICGKPVAAVVWTYGAVAALMGVTGSMAAASYSFRMFGPGSGGAAAPFAIGLSPFSVTYAVGTYTEILGYPVPNWLMAAVVVLIAVRLCLLGAGALLSDGRETPNLRINWAILVAGAAYGLCYWFVASGGYSSLATMPAYTPPENWPFRNVDGRAVILGYGLFWLLTPLVLVLPNLVAYGGDGALRQRPNGWFGFRRMLDGTPAGALPYIVSLVVLACVFGLLGIKTAGGDLPSASFLVYPLYAIGFWGLFWAIARTASSYGVGLRAARTTLVAAFVVLVALPVPFLAAVSAETFNEKGISAWDLYLLRPVLQFKEVNIAQPLVYGLGLVVIALGLNAWADRNWQRKGAAVRA